MAKRVSSSGELGWQSGLGVGLVEWWSWIRIPLDLCFFHLHRTAEFEAHKLTLVFVQYHKEKLLRHSVRYFAHVQPR